MRKKLLALLLALAPGLCAAETVFIEDFNLEHQEVSVSCDIERLLEKTFVEKGLDIVKPTAQLVPDLVVTGSYRNKGARVYATVNVADTVGERTAYTASLLMPLDENNCSELITRIAGKVDESSDASRRKTFVDADTGINFIFVPGGSFRMGVPEERASYVTVGSFFIGDREVTQGQYKKLMGTNPSYFQGDDLPVENVSWFDAVEYIRLLNERTGRLYRLPTEAEWEYAARSRGRNFKWSGTNQLANLDRFAWVESNAGRTTHPAGTRRANGLGLFDMSGNVWEWTADRYVNETSRGKMGTRSENKVIKGGSWMMDATWATLYSRDSSAPETRYQDNGFRLVLEVSTPKPAVAARPQGKIHADSVAKQ